MSVLTFSTAPWVMGIMYKTFRMELPIKQVFVTFCAWMFSASWSYDLYLLIRDGNYPATWLPNLFLSSVMYISAGLLWNLDWKEGRGVIFSFMEKDWPATSTEPVFQKILLFAMPFIILVVCMVLPFIVRST